MKPLLSKFGTVGSLVLAVFCWETFQLPKKLLLILSEQLLIRRPGYRRSNRNSKIYRNRRNQIYDDRFNWHF